MLWCAMQENFQESLVLSRIGNPREALRVLKGTKAMHLVIDAVAHRFMGALPHADAALDRMTSLISTRRERACALYERGNLHMLRGEFSLAETVVRTFLDTPLAREGFFAPASYALACVALEQGNHNDAITHVKRALETTSHSDPLKARNVIAKCASLHVCK
jgi:tetratricopeptide (TPR) repeat protein